MRKDDGICTTRRGNRARGCRSLRWRPVWSHPRNAAAKHWMGQNGALVQLLLKRLKGLKRGELSSAQLAPVGGVNGALDGVLLGRLAYIMSSSECNNLVRSYAEIAATRSSDRI